MYENLWKSWKSQKTTKVLRKQEANLESSEGFFRGSSSLLNRRAKAWADMLRSPSKAKKIHEIDAIHKNLRKSLNIYKINVNLKKSIKIMEVLRGQEANLESSNDFYRGSSSPFNRRAKA